MDHASTPEEKPHKESTPFRKSTFYLWMTSYSALIGIFIAVTIVVAGSIIVFGNNATQKAKNKQTAQKQQAKKEKLNTKNLDARLTENSRKIEKRIKRADRSLRSTRQYAPAKDTRSLGASVAGGTPTAQDVELLADRRIKELWQAQNAVEANEDVSQSLRSQIVRKINGKIGKVDGLKKSIPEDGTPVELQDTYEKLQDQKVYTCYLPNITKQTVNEDFAALIRDQNTVTKELRTVSGDLKKQKRKTDKLNDLIDERNQQLRQASTAVQALRQNGIQAENSNCATPSPYSLSPIRQELSDVRTLDQQIRETVDQILKESGVGKKPAAIEAPKTKKSEKKLAREEKRNAKGGKKKEKDTKVDPTESEVEPTESESSPGTPTPSESGEAEEPTPTPEETAEPEGEPLEKPDYEALGLPQSQTDAVNDLKAQIEDDEKADWAVTALLKAEKTAIDKGVDIIPYLTTAWIWFESGATSWPDPYAVNCNDNRPGYYSEVSVICKLDNFQVAGYQAAAQKSQYVSLFTKFYDPEDLPEVVNRVASDSTNAIRPQWNYNDTGQQKGVLKQYITQLGSVKIGYISPNLDFFSEKGQFFSLLVGKDPNMVIALNSFAVSEDDLIAALKSEACTYKYICAEEKQELSNMVGALYLIDGGTL